MIKLRFFPLVTAPMLIGAVLSAEAGNLSRDSAAVDSDLWLQSQKGGYSVEFVNNGEVAGIQFDIRDRRIKEGAFNCGTPALLETHTVNCNLHEDDGFLRVVVFAVPSVVVPDSKIVEITFDSSGLRDATQSRGELLTSARARAELSGVTLADVEAVDVTPSHLNDDAEHSVSGFQ